MMRKIFLSLTALIAGSASSALACSTTTPCDVADGEYFIAMPEGEDGPVPAVMYLHGFGGSGEGVFRNTGMVNRFLDRGYAVIAPNGTERANGRGRSWSFHPAFVKQREESDFLASVREDVIANHNVDPDRMVLSGFSIGGSMVAYLACDNPEVFAAYAPVGGNFWRPHPTECVGPVKMLHTHGWSDGTVPLEGRLLRGDAMNAPGSLAQGDVFHALDIWRQTNGCAQYRPDGFSTDGPFWIRKWDQCAEGSILEFALFPGGHQIPNGWAEMTMDWFEGLDLDG